MAIGAPYLALLYLSFDCLPATISDSEVRQVGFLLSSDMVKLQDQWISLAAIYAGMML